jgi:V8-like Glu-specific endopeptidase
MGILGSRETFRDVRRWYSRLAVLDRQICRVERLDGQPLGTGFLVAPDLVMTADHVVNVPGHPREPGAGFRTRFDYAVSPDTGARLDGTPYDVASTGWLVASSPPFGTGETRAVDVALVRLAQPAGLAQLERSGVRGWVDLSDAVDTIVESSSLAIMQHPEGGPLKLSLNTQAVLGLDPQSGRLMYRTDTLPGSSGAPCFDMDWRFVAMHEGRDVRGGNHNRGIPFAMIREWLDAIEAWPQVSARSPAAVGAVAQDGQSGSPSETQFAMSPQLRALVGQGEGQLIEFKRGITAGRGPGDKKVEMKKVLTSVAAFMNSREGGNVIIGVEDDGTFVGIEQEYAAVNPHSATWDGYDRYLNSALIDNLDVDSPFNFFNVTRYHHDGRDICVIHVEPSDRPVFYDQVLYHRVSAQNRPLRGREVLSYVAGRWSWLGDRPSTPATAPAIHLEALRTRTRP